MDSKGWKIYKPRPVILRIIYHQTKELAVQLEEINQIDVAKNFAGQAGFRQVMLCEEENRLKRQPEQGCKVEATQIA